MISLHVPLSWLVDTSLRVSAAIVLLMLLRPLLRRWVGSGGVALLWLAVAARLLLPWPVESRWSVLNYWPARAAEQRQVDEGAGTLKVRVGVQPTAGKERAKQTEASAAFNHSSDRAQSGSTAPDWDAWNILWLVGAALGMANLIYRWQQTRNWAAQTSPGSDNPRLAEAFAALPEAHRRGVELRITDALSAPTLAGVLHPQIWMPRAWLDRLTTEELRHVLLHELGHARRRDLSAQWVCALACCIHWFNPFVWLAARLARADREMACDAWVLARCGVAPTDYGNTLIKIVQHLRSTILPASPVAVSMAAGKRGMNLRVREIGAFAGASRWRPWVAMSLAAVMGLAFTSNRVSSAQEQEKVESSSNATAAPTATPTLKQEPVEPTGNGQSANTSTPVFSTPAVETKQTTGAPDQPFQVEIEAKIIGLTRQTVERLKAQTAKDPDDSGLIDQLATSYAPKSGTDASNPAPGVQMASRIITPAQLQSIIRRLNENSADLISTPRVTTKSGQKATIEIIREFTYPTKLDRTTPSGPPLVANFEKKNLGVTLAVEPNISPDNKLIDLSISWQQVFVQGFMDPKAGRLISVQQSAQPGAIATQPVFSTQVIDAMVTLSPDQTVVLSGPRWDPALWGEIIERDRDKHENNEELLLNFLTVHLITPNGEPPMQEGFDIGMITIYLGWTMDRMEHLPPEQFESGMNRLKELADKTPKQKATMEQSIVNLRKRYEASKALRESSAPGSAIPSPAAAPARTDYPYGTPVPGKPGYIISPYAPDSGYIDVRGYPSGSEVRDPYTNKLILIP